ncbi:Retrovirus-related Pol polyprotein from transposon RE1 [Vitis vinifera]|uniref:Retrovirus-related Pol polyprotein from transposon RE1 n=1 Tax=Vitis vinifera TaxID=29760 RepID=A0A438K4I7_VITVI|nr:Retrovirus-related Pol polyprotein from transposon RE1 [Vitis vinifera]
MIEDSPCESFELLDLPHVSTHGDEPKSSESITPESPNFTTEPMSSLVPASVTRNFPQFPKYDVKNAFLHGDLDEEIYMNILPGFEGNTVMKESEYKQSQDDHTLFIKHSAVGGVTALLVYVDNIIVTGNDEREKHEVKQRLATEFEIKELRKLKLRCKPVFTPMDPNHKLGEAKEEPVVDKRMYQRLVGRLICLAHTRPDIAYSVSVISQFMHDPREPHLQATYRLKIILNDLRIKWDGPMKLYCDNKSAINIAHNPIQHDRTKHIEIDRHFIKEKLEEEVVCMSYIPSEHQLADILTKGLNSSMFHDLIFMLGMEDIYSSASGGVLSCK